MKYSSFMFVLLNICLINNAIAGKCDSLYPNMPTAGEIDTQIPFVTQAVNNGELDDGLCFSYDMKQIPTQKIICTFTNFNEGWMLFRDNNRTKESNYYKGAKTIILTSVGPTQVISETLEQFHVDENGVVAIHHFRDDNFPEDHAVASCSYIPEEK